MAAARTTGRPDRCIQVQLPEPVGESGLHLGELLRRRIRAAAVCTAQRRRRSAVAEWTSASARYSLQSSNFSVWDVARPIPTGLPNSWH